MMEGISEFSDSVYIVRNNSCSCMRRSEIVGVTELKEDEVEGGEVDEELR